MTERLNSLLEVEREFYLSEDLAWLDAKIPVHPGLRLVATVHTPVGSPSVADWLNPSVASRFTAIPCAPYAPPDLEAVLLHCATEAVGPEAAAEAVRCVARLRALLAPLGVAPSVTACTRWCRYLRLPLPPSTPSPLVARLVLGARFLFLEGLPAARRVALDWPAIAALVDPPEPGLAQLLSDPAAADLHAPFSVVPGEPPRLTYLSLPLPPLLQGWSQIGFPSLVPTAGLVGLTAAVACALHTACPLLLSGPPGAGKTAVLREVAAMAGRSFFAVQCHDALTVQDFFGGFAPVADADGHHRFVWRCSLLVEALREGALVVLEDVQQLPSELWQSLIPLMDASAPGAVQPLGCPTPVHVDAPLIFATCTTGDDDAGRGVPPELAMHFMEVAVPDMSEVDLRAIAERLVGARHADPAVTDGLLAVHYNAVPIAAAADGADQRTVRALLKLVRCLGPADADPLEGLAVAAGLLYADCCPAPRDQDRVRSFIATTFGLSPDVVAGLGTSGAEPSGTGAPDAFCRTPFVERLMGRLEVAVRSGCAVLLEGPTCSGKTELVRQFARRQRRALTVVSVHAEMELADLLGGPAPCVQFQDRAVSANPRQVTALLHETLRLLLPHVDAPSAIGKALLEAPDAPARAALLSHQLESCPLPPAVLQEARQRLETLRARLASAARGGAAFSEMEGPLVRALREGQWVLLDNLNFASPALLAALLPLMGEAQGPYQNAACGAVPVHADFRLFATSNVARGRPLPTPLLDRGVRLCLVPLDYALRAAARREAVEHGDMRALARTILHRRVGPLADRLLAFHGDVVQRQLQLPAGYRITFRNLLHAAAAIRRTMCPRRALQTCYADVVLGAEGQAAVAGLLERHQLQDDGDAVAQVWGQKPALGRLLQLQTASATAVSAFLGGQRSALLQAVARALALEAPQRYGGAAKADAEALAAEIRRSGSARDRALLAALTRHLVGVVNAVRAVGVGIPAALQHLTEALGGRPPRAMVEEAPGGQYDPVSAPSPSAEDAGGVEDKVTEREVADTVPAHDAVPPEAAQEEPGVVEAKEPDVAPDAANGLAAADSEPQPLPEPEVEKDEQKKPVNRWKKALRLQTLKALAHKRLPKKARAVMKEGARNSYQVLTTHPGFALAVRALVDATLARDAEGAGGATCLAAGADRVEFGVLVDNGPASPEVANALTAVLTLVCHVLDQLEQPFRVLRCYRPYADDLLLVKDPARPLREVNGQKLLDQCRTLADEPGRPPDVTEAELTEHYGPEGPGAAVHALVAVLRDEPLALSHSAATAGGRPLLRLVVADPSAALAPNPPDDPPTLMIAAPRPCDAGEVGPVCCLPEGLPGAAAGLLQAAAAFARPEEDAAGRAVWAARAAPEGDDDLGIQEIAVMVHAAMDKWKEASAGDAQVAFGGLQARLLSPKQAMPGLAPLSVSPEQLQAAAAETGPALTTAALEKVEALWAGVEHLTLPCRDHLLDAVRRSAWPAVQYTRCSPGLQGSKLSLRGLLRYFSTNGQYLKIWEQRDQGAQICNAVCLVVDVSASAVGDLDQVSHYRDSSPPSPF